MAPRTDFDSDIIIAFAKGLAASEGAGGLYARIAAEDRSPQDVDDFKSYLRRAKALLTALAGGEEGLAVIPTTPPEPVRDAINDAVLQNIDMHGDWIGRLEWQSYLWKAAYIETVRHAPFAVTPHGKGSGSALPGDRLQGAGDTEMVILPVAEIEELVDGDASMKSHASARDRVRTLMGKAR